MMKAGPMTTNQQKHFLEDYLDWIESNKESIANNAFSSQYQQLITQAMLEMQKKKIVDAVNAEMMKKMDELLDDKQTKEVFSPSEKNTILLLKSLADTAIDGLVKKLKYVPSFDNVVLAGGCFTSWYHHEKPKDIDIFVLNDGYAQSVFADSVRRFCDGAEDGTDKYVRNAPHVQTLYNWKDPDSGMRYQFIFTDYATREELVASFDLAHCQVSFYHDKLYITRTTYDAIRDKKLIINKGKNVPDWRINKFINRGFKFVEDKITSPSGWTQAQAIPSSYAPWHR